MSGCYFLEKVENWLKKNEKYIRGHIYDDINHKDVTIRPSKCRRNRIKESIVAGAGDDSSQSVDTAKYILSNKKKSKTKSTKMTIKEYCFMAKKSQSQIILRKSSAPNRLPENANNRKSDCRKCSITVIKPARKLRSRQSIILPPHNDSSSSDDGQKEKRKRKRKVKSNRKIDKPISSKRITKVAASDKLLKK